ncbi:hypothetical protein ACFFRR_005850 [Megaselia abdita]
MNPIYHNIPKYESNLYSSNFLSSSLFDSVNKVRPQENTLAQKTKTKDSITTLLSSFNDIDDKCVDNFMKANITTSDLSSLTKKDLEVLGIKIQQQQNDLLDSFHRLPKQDISYDRIIHSAEAQNWNGDILLRSTEHLIAMKSSLAAANYKLKYSPCVENIILGDKNFASKFVVEALNELRNATKEMDSELNKIEGIISEKNEKRNRNLIFQISASIFALIGFAIGYWLLKSK